MDGSTMTRWLMSQFYAIKRPTLVRDVMTKNPPIDLLRKLFRYEPKTGLLFWSEAEEVTPYYRGKQAFTSKGSHGYYQTNYRGIVMLAHRVIWAMTHGEWPVGIDHISADRTDNRIKNLREAPASVNRRNTPIAANNNSGVMGVSWDRINRKWVVRIKGRDGAYKNLGRFSSKREAIATRKLAEREHGYHRNHGRVRK